MTTPRKLDSMIHDEHKAVREYGSEARRASSRNAKTFRHIRNEERQHASSLKRMRKRMSRRGGRR